MPTAILPPNDFSCCFSGCCSLAQDRSKDRSRLGPRSYFHRDRAFRICFRQPRWSPLGSALAGTRHPPRLSRHRQSVLTMVVQHLSRLRQGWVVLASHQTLCPRSCSRHRTSAAAYCTSQLPQEYYLAACSHASTIGEFRNGGTAALSAAPAVSGVDLHRTLLVPCVRCWSSSQPARRKQGPASMYWPMKLHGSLLLSLRVFVSPATQSAPLPGSLWRDGFMYLTLVSNRIGTKQSVPT